MSREPIFSDQGPRSIVRKRRNGGWVAWSWAIAWGRSGFEPQLEAVLWACCAPAALGMCRAFEAWKLNDAEPTSKEEA